MAFSSLTIPFRRFLHSTRCARLAAFPAQPFPQDSEHAGQGPEKAEGLVDLLKTVAGEAHNFESKTPAVVSFSDSQFIRPADLHRDIYKHKQRSFAKRLSVGPGREARYNDVFLQLGIDPRREADNVALMSSFTTRLGRIQPRNTTGLTQRSQRLLGKAIKRSQMMGIIPKFSNTKASQHYAVQRIKAESARRNAEWKKDKA